jgi:hypothetical protein
MNAFLVRTQRTKEYTRGLLIVGGQMFHTLEPPWRDNRRNVSCIPEGRYSCHFLPRSNSGKYRNIYHVRDVEGRSGILVHNGNIVRHTLGCVLIGMQKGKLNGKPAVLKSFSALKKLMRLTDKGVLKLVIV